ncbi:MAG TPA: FAD-dependent oxidoreductase [Thermodesulfobacteriota bacterium]|nr:FAD-dependent oxidoreductase [Thermodesulfobacteriota bacterium]
MAELCHYSAVILGAGLCGLSAAYHLEEKGKTDYLVLERDHDVGGLARTVTYDGFSFDHASHILFSGDPYATDLICNKLLNGNTRKQIRQSYCYTAGVYTEYPYQVNNYGLPPAVIAENIMGLIEARYELGWGGPPPHFEAWIYRTFGRGIAKNFMIPYNRRVWAWDLQDMNYDWIADRVPVPNINDVLLGALQPGHKRYGPNQEFWYPEEGGIEALPRAFLRYIPSERFWLDARVVGIDSVRREVFLADGRRVRYNYLISTLPLPVLINLCGNDVPPSILNAAKGLKCNVVLAVNIGLVGTDFSTTEMMHWIYFPEETTIFHRVGFPGNLSSRMVPSGCSSIQVEISESVHCPRNRETLIQKSLEDLARVGILKKQETRLTSDGGRVLVAEVMTLNPAYIIYDLQHRENTRTVRDYLGGLNIITRGRFGEWEYLNMDHVILSGKDAAESIL